jgi:23S rRNA (guanosine2251-2'-O)-methyltransferase
VAKKTTPAKSGRGRSRGRGEGTEIVYGRNPVVEAIRAGVPGTALYVQQFIDTDDRVREALTAAGETGLALLEVPRSQLDDMTNRGVHHGLALAIPPYEYAEADELLAAAGARGEAALIVALDGVTDPRNLGAVIRSAAAFGAHGVVVPQRRAAGITAAAWKTSAGAAARIPVARVTNLTRALTAYGKAGAMVVGLAAGGDPLTGLDPQLAAGPLVVVVGGEGAGLSRLVAQTCDLIVGIGMASEVE